MNIINNRITASILSAVCCISLAGCGSDESKLAKMEATAMQYMDEKYSIEPEIINSSFQGGGDLTTVSEAKSGGYVKMNYNGKEFWVYVDLKDHKYDCDNYMRDETESEMTAYFTEKLKCDALCAEYSYGRFGGMQSMAKDMTCWQDIFKSDIFPNSKISINTRGLDKNSIGNIDLTIFGDRTDIFISDYKSSVNINDKGFMNRTSMPEQGQIEDLNAYYYIHGGTIEMKEYE